MWFRQYWLTTWRQKIKEDFMENPGIANSAKLTRYLQ
jgi:hypothetical protein